VFIVAISRFLSEVIDEVNFLNCHEKTRRLLLTNWKCLSHRIYCVLSLFLPTFIVHTSRYGKVLARGLVPPRTNRPQDTPTSYHLVHAGSKQRGIQRMNSWNAVGHLLYVGTTQTVEWNISTLECHLRRPRQSGFDSRQEFQNNFSSIPFETSGKDPYCQGRKGFRNITFATYFYSVCRFLLLWFCLYVVCKPSSWPRHSSSG
jgi:hypothetical protein